MKRKAILGVFGLLIVVALLVILFAGGKKEDLADRSEPVENSESISETLVMQPVETDSYTYKFQGIDWMFEEGEEGTKVNFMFDRFSRKDGVFVTFGNPYKLGSYEGACQALESIAYDAEANPGIPLAFAECRGAAKTRQFMLVQQAEEVVAKSRVLYEEIEGDTDALFASIYTINLTEIVQ